MSESTRLFIVGSTPAPHVGWQFLQAAEEIGWAACLEDSRKAWSTNLWLNRFCHHLLAKRPPYLARFGKHVVEACAEFKPDIVLSTGIAPLAAASLRAMRDLGCRTVNFLTDDPWNPLNGAGFFWDSLREYDLIISPRRSNIPDLLKHGCRRVEYLPFAYNPKIHFIEDDPSEEELRRFSCEVAILGGADADRLPLARALADAGFDLALYGGYWDRDPVLKRYWRGFVHGRDLRLAVRLAGCHVCMGRKANRDGHAMRSIEFPAMGACLVVEDTGEHRDLYGPEGECVLYWTHPEDLVRQTRILLEDRDLRSRLTAALHRRITHEQSHCYIDRLLQIREMVLS